MYVFIFCTFTSECKHACMKTYLYVGFMYVHVCACTCVRECARRVCVCACIRVYVPECMCMEVYLSVCLCMCVFINRNVIAGVSTSMNTDGNHQNVSGM